MLVPLRLTWEVLWQLGQSHKGILKRESYILLYDINCLPTKYKLNRFSFWSVIETNEITNNLTNISDL